MIEVICTTDKATVRLAIDERKHDAFDVLSRSLALFFPDADPKAEDPKHDEVMKAQRKRLAARKRKGKE